MPPSMKEVSRWLQVRVSCNPLTLPEFQTPQGSGPNCNQPEFIWVDVRGAPKGAYRNNNPDRKDRDRHENYEIVGFS
jgi:hypothetical protein